MKRKFSLHTFLLFGVLLLSFRLNAQKNNAAEILIERLQRPVMTDNGKFFEKNGRKYLYKIPGIIAPKQN